jgi:hypothetical protein
MIAASCKRAFGNLREIGRLVTDETENDCFLVNGRLEGILVETGVWWLTRSRTKLLLWFRDHNKKPFCCDYRAGPEMQQISEFSGWLFTQRSSKTAAADFGNALKTGILV